MLKISWNDLIKIVKKEGSCNRAVWHVIGYGIFKKGRKGYTLKSLIKICESNFGMSIVETKVALIELHDKGFVDRCPDEQDKAIFTLTEKGRMRFEIKYMKKDVK